MHVNHNSMIYAGAATVTANGGKGVEAEKFSYVYLDSAVIESNVSYAPLVNLPGFQSGGLTPFPSLKPRKVHKRSIFDACF
jgi:hypothetical protein